MKQLKLHELVLVSGGAPGGPAVGPKLPPRAGETEEKTTNADGSYQPAT